MQKSIVVTLAGQATSFRLEEAAYDRLSAYLDRAAVRLRDDPDRAEVLGDLERSIGDRLSVAIGAGDRLVTAMDVDGVLDQVGAVDAGRGASPADDERPRRRRLQRVREGQDIAGVCTGIAAYSEIDVDWVRTVFVLGALVTGGILIVVYIALALILPVAATPAR